MLSEAKDRWMPATRSFALLRMTRSPAGGALAFTDTSRTYQHYCGRGWYSSSQANVS